MIRRSRILVLPFFLLLVLGAFESRSWHGPEAVSSSAASHAPGSVVAGGSGSLEDAVFPAHVLRDTHRAQRALGFVPTVRPWAPSAWRIAPAGSLLRSFPAAASMDAAPRGPPAFA